MSSLIGLFIGRQGDWKMVKLSRLVAQLRAVNVGCLPIITLYLYEEPAYSIIYGIIKPYQNYSNQLKIPVYNQFYKAMSCLDMKVEHRFAIYQNL